MPEKIFTHLDKTGPGDSRRAPSGDWVLLGPGGGGCVHTLTVNPHHPDTLVVSCDMTAGYITHNGGKSWCEFNLKSRQYAYAFDPVDPDSFYVGSSGLFRSVDNGASFDLVFPDPALVTGETRLGDEATHTFLSNDNWPGGTIHSILIDPLQPQNLFIAIKKGGALRPVDIFYNRMRSGIFIFSSTDRGVTWEQKAELEAEEIHLLCFDPHSPVAARDLFAFTEKGITKILVDGKTEELVLPGSIVSLRHASCGLNPALEKTIFYISAVEKNADGQYASTVWKSNDLGRTWQQSVTGLETFSPSAPPAFSQVSASACDARRVWLIAEKFPELDEAGRRVDRHGILRSDNEGLTWEWAVKMDDDHDPVNRSGGWAERDYGAAWGDIKGDDQISPKGRFAWDVVASSVDPEVCYTMDFSTIFKTSDGGMAWEQLVTDLHPDRSASSRGIDVLTTYGVHFDPFDPQHIVFSITDVGIFHSRNGGRTWHHSLAGVPRNWINTCYWMVFDPQVRGRAWSVWAAMHDLPRLKMFRDELFDKFEGGICKTEDGLQTWHPSAQGLPKHAICTHIMLDPDSPAGQRTLYAAVLKDGVYKSTDDGKTWYLRNNGIDLRNLFAWRLVLTPNGTLYLVVVKNRMQGHEYTGAIYQSTDGAGIWNPVPLPDGVDFPNDLTCDSNGRLYLSCWPRLVDGANHGGGAYASDDGGRTWISVFDKAAHVYATTVDPVQPSTLYIATFLAGVYQSLDRGKTWAQLKGCDFQWNHRVVTDPNRLGRIYLTTFGSSVWYGTPEEVLGNPAA